MISVLIYATDARYLDKTIDGLLDCTPHLGEVIVCDDVGLNYERTGVRVVRTDGVGRAKAWNTAVVEASHKVLVFLKDKTRVSPDWILPLMDMLDADPNGLVSPVVHTLDPSLWTTDMNRWRRFGWRWDMNVHDRAFDGRPDSPSVSSYCIVCRRAWFDEIGGFDAGMGPGAGEDIEISLRSWLLGGSVRVADDSIIAAALEVDYDPRTVNNLARIVEAWLPAQSSRFYGARGIKPTDVMTGRLNGLASMQSRQKRPIEWFLANLQPELHSIYALRGSATGRSVAVVGPGPSLDYVNMALIARHDFVIGVDYVGLMIDCDFVMTDAVHVTAELRSKYRDEQFVVPVALQDRVNGRVVPAGEVLPGCHQFEMMRGGTTPTSLDPPLCNFESMALSAVHLAMFLSPASITVYGCDNKLVGGKSHTSKLDHYDGGLVWPDVESTRRKFAFYEYGLDQLGQLAHAAGIPLLRVCHA